MASYFETFSLTSRSRRCREVSDAVVWTFSWHRGRWQLFGCCSGSRRGRCNSSVFGSWSAPCSRARPCARGQLSFVLNRHLSVSQQPLPSLRSRSQEAQMRCSCLDAAESFLGHGAWRSLMGLLTKLISSLMDRSLSSVRQRVEQSHFSRKSRRGAKRRSSHGRQVLYTRFCGTFFDGRSTLLPVLKATPFRGLLVQTRRCPRVIRGVFSFRGADFVPVPQRAHDSQSPSGCARREPGALCRTCGVLRDGQDHAFVPCGEPLCCSVLPQDGWRVTCVTIRHCELSDETRSVKPIVFPRTRAPRLVTTDTQLALGIQQFCLYRGARPWPLWATACQACGHAACNGIRKGVVICVTVQ